MATGDADIRRTGIDDGRAFAELAVTNSGDETDSYAIQADFHDRHGDPADIEDGAGRRAWAGDGRRHPVPSRPSSEML
ncbi:hypothetical protein ABZ281_08485 [Streptomyces sp. NPDC006265]|uniref:hypothetical protein n=1 Tax=Streptomyces sp. NPDC006265 TaxID=3156740 RepID=UPI0033B5C91C